MTESLQILILALTIWHEARGEGEQGMRLVADTISNRAKQSKTCLVSVVTMPAQYECWSNKDPERADIPKQKSAIEKHNWQYCLILARLLRRGAYKPATDSTHYWRKDSEMKAWQYEMETVIEHKQHIFAKVSSKTKTTEGVTE